MRHMLLQYTILHDTAGTLSPTIITEMMIQISDQLMVNLQLITQLGTVLDFICSNVIASGTLQETNEMDMEQ